MKGIVPSLNTPFDVDGALDHVSLRRLVNHTVESGCSGMLCLAVAGEYMTLNSEEKIAFIETISQTNAGRIPFIVSVTAPKLQSSIELARTATLLGAAGVCVQLPNVLDRLSKLDFLKALVSEGPSLLMVQDLDWTGGGMPIEEIQFLFDQVEAFSWLKIETQNAGQKYSTVTDATQGALNVCGGWAVTQLMDALARGIHTFIPTGLERVYVGIYEAYKNENIGSAAALFERLLPVLEYSNQHIDISIRFFKELRKAEGLFDTNICRTVADQYERIDENASKKALNTALALMKNFEKIEPK